MKRRALSVFLAMIMVLSLLPVTALATETYVASVKFGIDGEEKFFTSLADAAAYAKSAEANSASSVTVYLRANVTTTTPFNLTGAKKLTKVCLLENTLTADGCTALILGDNAGFVEILGHGGGTAKGGIVAGEGYAAVESSGTGTVTFNQNPSITGNIKYTGTGEMNIVSGTYTGNIENVGSGSLTIEQGPSWTTEHDGTLTESGVGALTVTGGSFDRDPSEFVDEECYNITQKSSRWIVTLKDSSEASIEDKVAAKGFSANSTRYETVTAAAAESSNVYLLTDVEEDFAFTYATKPGSRKLFLEGHKYRGSITDKENRDKNGAKPMTVIDGVRLNTKIYEGGRGTAVLTRIETTEILKIQYGADVTIQDGSTNGLYIDSTSTLTIYGGTYTGSIDVEQEKDILVRKENGVKIYMSAPGGKLTITGGTFDVDVSDWCADGYFAKKNDNNKYVVTEIKNEEDAVEAGNVAADDNGKYYKTVQAAAAASSSVSLLKGVTNGVLAFTYGAQHEADSDHTLYLRGYTYSGKIEDSSASPANSTIIDGNGSSKKAETGRGTATLTSITTNKTLKVQNNADVTIETGSAAGIDVDGTSTLTINGGSFGGAINVAQGGTLKITGGTFNGTLPATQSGTLIIEGGTFSENPSEFLAKNKYLAKKNNEGRWEVARMTVGEAAEQGYVAGIYKYIDGNSRWYGPYYTTVQAAADESSSVALLKNVNLADTDAKGFTFTYGASAATKEERILYLGSNGYQGSIKDNTKKLNDKTKDETIIDGNGNLGKDTTNRGKAILTSITTKVTLVIQNNADVTIDGAESRAAGLHVNGSSTLTINGGTYTGTITVATGGTLTITGGTFDKDVTQYCAAGYMAKKVTSGGADSYKVVPMPEKTSSSVTTTVTESEKAGEMQASVDSEIKGDDKTTATGVAKSVSTGLRNTTDTVRVSDTQKQDAIRALLAKAQIKLNNDDEVVPPDESTQAVTITLIKEPYLEVEVKTLAVSETSSKEITMDITPKYNLLAQATIGDGTPETPVTVSTGNPLTVDEATTVTVTLPSGFANKGDTVYIKHEKNETFYYYQGTVGDKDELIFTSTHGFSPFTFSLTSDAVAEITTDGTTIGYATLQKAVNEAKNGDTIKLVDNCDEGEVNVSGKSLTIDKNNKTFDFGKVTVGSFSTKLENGNTLTIVYAPPAATGAYAVTVEDSKHGAVTADRKTASSGATVTLTVAPDKGWTLETLTVTDRNGKELDLDIVTLGEKYSFKMPSGSVTVAATFMEDNTMLNYFIDVNARDYFYDAVLWAAENSVTSGTDALHFSPNAPCTRAQIVTFLWRAAGSPEAKSASSFSDVAAGSYYAKAVAWAVENNVTIGTSATTFSPDEPCTRAHGVTFLYRLLGGQTEASAKFADVPSGSYYESAVDWAVASAVTEGTSAATFSPNDDCTRAQMVTFLYRAYNK